METEDLLRDLLCAANGAAANAALARFIDANQHVAWLPVGGRANNRGIIEVSGHPGRAIVERVTNAIDAVLEAEYQRHAGKPNCPSPRHAASAWLNVPEDGLSAMSAGDRRKLAQLVTVRLGAGDGPTKRVIEVMDQGTGVSREQLPKTILSLNESNKLQKPHLAGTYGQGGSATFASCEISVIASKMAGAEDIAFTVVRFDPPPPDVFKGGSYVFLTIDGQVLSAKASDDFKQPGTRCLHFGYDLTKFVSPLGPNSVYGLLQQVMFHPVLPIWLIDDVQGYRRVIKGSRNALNGAVDDENDDESEPKLAHHMPMFYVSLGEFGRAGIEYWLLPQPEGERKRPTASFLDPLKPIVLTLNGQNQAEMGVHIIRKNAELPFLAQRLICHIDCNTLSTMGLRSLFASNREGAKKGIVFQMLETELVSALRSDDELARQNVQARDQSQRKEDQEITQRMRKEVAKLLRLQGFEVTTEIGAVSGGQDDDKNPATEVKPRPKPKPIDLHEPPTFIKIIWPEDLKIGLFPEQRRYIRIETDASSRYHDPKDPKRSQVNIIVSGDGFLGSGSTPLTGGRFRVIVDCASDAKLSAGGRLQVELRIPGRPTLSDNRMLEVVEAPKAKGSERKIVMPPFKVEPVNGPEDPQWLTLGWPENISEVASSGVTSGGILIVYYSTVFPRYSEYRRKLEAKSVSLGVSFDARYQIWLAVHSLILDKEERESKPAGGNSINMPDVDEDFADRIEHAERCRVATMAAMFASQEVIRPDPVEED